MDLFNQLNELNDRALPAYKLPCIKVSFAREENKVAKKFSSSREAASIARAYLKELGTLQMQESFLIMPTDSKLQPLGIIEVSRGAINATLVDIRIVLGLCLVCNAVGFIAFHNHPTGNLSASEQDKNLTKKLDKASKIMDIKLVDHIIVTENGHTSFKDEGLF